MKPGSWKGRWKCRELGILEPKRSGEVPGRGSSGRAQGEPSTQNHLVDAALNDGEESQGYCVETEENIIDSHRVHPAGITDQEFLLKVRESKTSHLS